MSRETELVIRGMRGEAGDAFAKLGGVLLSDDPYRCADRIWLRLSTLVGATTAFPHTAEYDELFAELQRATEWARAAIDASFARRGVRNQTDASVVEVSS